MQTRPAIGTLVVFNQLADATIFKVSRHAEHSCRLFVVQEGLANGAEQLVDRDICLVPTAEQLAAQGLDGAQAPAPSEAVGTMTHFKLLGTLRQMSMVRLALAHYAFDLGRQLKNKGTMSELDEQEIKLRQDVGDIAELDAQLEPELLQMQAAGRIIVKHTPPRLVTGWHAWYVRHSSHPHYVILNVRRRASLSACWEELASINLTYEDAGKVLCLIGSVNREEAAKHLGIDYSVGS